MATQTLTEANFAEVTSEGIVLVDFWADWCGPCKRFAPTYEKASEEHPNIVFGKVDTEAEQQIAAQFEIRSIPTIMAIRDGVIVFEQAGALPAVRPGAAHHGGRGARHGAGQGPGRVPGRLTGLSTTQLSTTQLKLIDGPVPGQGTGPAAARSRFACLEQVC